MLLAGGILWRGRRKRAPRDRTGKRLRSKSARHPTAALRKAAPQSGHPHPPQGIQIRRRHLIRPTSRRERAQPPTLAAANHIPPRSQPPNQASSRQGRHLSWRYVAPQPKRTGRRQRVRFLATDAFGRPGPGRSPGRSLPSFCRYRKKGPAGEALEEMPFKITEKGQKGTSPKKTAGSGQKTKIKVK